MKKIISMFLVCISIFCLCACSENTKETTTTAINETIQTTIVTDVSAVTKTTETEKEEKYPLQITSLDGDKIACWLLSEPIIVAEEKVYDVYAEIDTSDDNWKEQTKMVISLLWNKYRGEKVMFKIYNGTEGINKAQPTYEELIAVWQSEPFSISSESKPQIIWYTNGGGVTDQQESEYWEPRINE